MNQIEIDRALRKLRRSGIAEVLDIRLQAAAATRLPVQPRYIGAKRA